MTRMPMTVRVTALLIVGACTPTPEAAPVLDQQTAALAQAVTEPTLLSYHPDLDIRITEMIHRSTGVLYRDAKLGTGDSLKVGTTAVVRYTGWLPDGTAFDSNRDSDPFSFRIGAGEVIEGWDDGLLGMRVGGTRQLVIPYQMGYGEVGSGNIPPYATLVFLVELLEARR